MKTNIALIGFMGAGKSAVGAALAEKLGKQFIETDALIEKKAGQPVPVIFEEKGEIAFREIEIEVIKEVAGKDNQVIACGGGVVLNRINVDRLKLKAVVVWLAVTPAAVLRRTGLDGEARPVLKQVKNLDELRGLIKFRQPLYALAADIRIDTSRLSIQATVEQIIQMTEEYADKHK